MNFSVALSLADTTWNDVARRSQLAEEAGIDGLWFMDHLIPPRNPDADLFEAWTSVAALAATTNRIRLGHLVGSIPLRNVGVIAKAATTVDVISDGRLQLGLGAGWFEREHRAFGIAFEPHGERLSLLRESIKALRMLFSGQSVDFAGKHVELKGAVSRPLPAQVGGPPIVVGGASDPLLGLAGELADVWNCPAPKLADLPRAIEKVRASAAGRDVRISANVAFLPGNMACDNSLLAELAWMGELSTHGILGSEARMQERVSAYRAAGVSELICQVPTSASMESAIDELALLAARS